MDAGRTFNRRRSDFARSFSRSSTKNRRRRKAVVETPARLSTKKETMTALGTVTFTSSNGSRTPTTTSSAT
jgi:hypothetical protein